MSDERRSRLPGCLLIGSLTVAAIGLVVFLAFEYSANRGRLAIQERLEAIRAEGLPTSSIELDEYYSIPDGADDVTNQWVLAIRELDQLCQDHSAGVPTIDPEVDPDYFNDLPMDGRDWPQLDAAREFLARARPALNRLHAAAAKNGEVRYPIDLTLGYMTALEDAQRTRTAARVLRLEMLVAAKDRSADDVTRCITTVFAAGESLHNEPLLVSQLIRIAVDSISLGMMFHAIPHVDFEERHFDQMERQFGAADYSAGFTSAFIGERAAAMEIFQNPGMLSAQEYGMERQTIIGPRTADALLYLDYSQRVIEASRKPFPEAIAQTQRIAADLESKLNDDTFLGKMKYAITRQVTPATDSALMAGARVLGVSRIAQVAIALRKHCDATGQLPSSLEALVPEHLPQVPADPFDGQPIRYRLIGKGETRLYLVGRDLKDDGGVAEGEGPNWIIGVDKDYVVRIVWPVQESK